MGRTLYLTFHPDIVATLEGLAPRGAGHEGLSLRCLANLESEWPIWRV